MNFGRLALLCSGAQAAATSSCITFGTGGMAEVYGCDSASDLGNVMPQTRSYEGQGAWVTELDDGVAILSGDGGTKVTFWKGGSQFTDVDLGGLVTPVGATLFSGKLYIACFGSWPNPNGDSGLAIVDVESQTLEGTYPFADPNLHIHNAYAFTINGQTEIFAAVLGNPWWEGGALPGKGLARFDSSTRSWSLDSTDEDLNVRSAKQQADGSIFVLTQEANGGATKLAKLAPVVGRQALHVQSTIELPKLPQGNGGADVILGEDPNTVWVTDRQDGSDGMLYHYTFSDNEFHMDSVRFTGVVPRYTVILQNGDIVTCNQDGGDLSVFKGLAKSPHDASITAQSVPTVNGPMFFLQTDKIAKEVLV